MNTPIQDHPVNDTEGQGQYTTESGNYQAPTGNLWGEFSEKHIQELTQKAKQNGGGSNGSEHRNFKPDTEWSGTQAIWPTTRLFHKALPHVLPMTEDMIPGPLRAWLFDIAFRMKCPVDYVASIAVVMLSSLIGTRLAIKPKSLDDWTIIVNLWGAIIGGPSVLKTPSTSEVLKALNRLVVAARAEHEDALSQYEKSCANYEAQKKAYVAQQAAELRNRSLGTSIEYPEAPKKPTERRYMTMDATIEKLADLLNENPTGIFQFRDELIGLLAGWEKAGREQDRAFYLEGWNGSGSITVDRIGRGTIHVDNICLSLFGNIQPQKLLGFLQAALGFENDGLVQRLQVAVYPDPSPWSWADQHPDGRARDTAFELIKRIADSEFSDIGYQADDYNRFPYTRFSPEAQEVFKQWLIHWETEVLPKEEHLLLEHFTKYRSLIPSLALIFHVADCEANPIEQTGNQKRLVSKQAIDMALLWCTYLQSHARRIYGLLDTANVVAAKDLLRHLKNGDLKDEFKARDIARKGWTNLGTVDQAENAIEELVDHGWLLPMKPKTQEGGRPPAIQYKINPIIFSKNVD